MPFSLLPSTPPGSPAIRSGTARRSILSTFRQGLQTIPGAVLRLFAEPLDPFGLAGVVAFAASAVSATASYVVWGLAMAGFHQYYGPVVAVVHFVSGALWGVAMGAGLMSARRLPRILAWSLLLQVTLYYGWDRLRLPGSVFPWNLVIHMILGATVALPCLLAQVRRRKGKSTA
jgi:hypothetical protein